jgi:hypothetical protein
MAASLATTGGLFAATTPASNPATESGLLLPPLLTRPTGSSIRISAINNQKDAEAFVEMRKEGASEWNRQPSSKVAAYTALDWTINGLSPATRYEYRVMLKSGSDESPKQAATGSFRTQRKGPASYTALLMTDPHTGSFPPGSGPVLTLDKVVQNASRVKDAEFVLDLGDNVAWAGSREYPQRNPNGATRAYAQYRRQIGPLSAHCPHFALIGNWGGESGKFPEKNIQIVATVRRNLLPGPNHETYPEGGSEGEDYYAFTWGDVLYVMLNIQTYSIPSRPDQFPTLMADVNKIEEWTLGAKQRSWFETTLKNATERFRFVCMHHPAAGNAGDTLNTLYGRGGSRAWNLGEQAKIHALMKKHKVQIFFYGHDHVFVDDIVDGIHYTLPGSCGAPWHFTKEETGYERFWPESGHAQLDVTPEKATVTFVNIDGKTLHSFSVRPV